MRTAAYKVDGASDRRSRKNVPWYILCSWIENIFRKDGRYENNTRLQYNIKISRRIL